MNVAVAEPGSPTLKPYLLAELDLVRTPNPWSLTFDRSEPAGAVAEAVDLDSHPVEH
jgi:hypothetical protein